MRKTETIYLGDKVKTKSTYKPLLKNDERFNPEGEIYEGIVVGKRGKYLMVDFHKKLPFTHYLGNMLQEPTGCGIEYKHLVVTETFKAENKEEQEFVGLMKELQFEEMNKLPTEIRQKEDNLRQHVSQIKNKLREVSDAERNVEREEFDLKSLKEKKVAASVDTDFIVKQYRQMKKNPKIKTIEILDTKGVVDILLTTKDLTYKNPRTVMPDYNLGAYKILIPMDINRGMQAINYKKHVKKFSYHHPCIHDSRLCLGNAVENEVYKLRNTNNIINLSHLLINFLEEPNYGGPHLSEELFYCNQPVTIRPRNKYDWFDMAYWNEKEVWDGAKYTADEKKIREKLRKLGAQVEEICPECGYDGDERDDDGDCPNCGASY